MLGAHHAIGTWQRQVDRFIALTDFAKQKHVEGGLASDRIAVKPNFVQADPGIGTGIGGYALYLGRLSAEKGVQTMLEAWQRYGLTVPLKVVGDGPLAPAVAAATGGPSSIEWLGHRDRADVLDLLRRATFLVCPSECYENFPLVVAEAFATGVPVIASDLGSIASIVRDGFTGLQFRTADAASLAERVEWAWSHPEDLASMRRNARAEYEALYTAERNHEMLMSVYQGAIGHARARLS
ncbi:MAG: glycosyltransferase family 4 protein [Gemmatimonadaceae bacterium]